MAQSYKDYANWPKKTDTFLSVMKTSDIEVYSSFFFVGIKKSGKFAGDETT